MIENNYDSFYTLEEIHRLLNLRLGELPYSELIKFDLFIEYRGFADLQKNMWLPDDEELPFLKQVFLEGLAILEQEANTSFYDAWCYDLETKKFPEWATLLRGSKHLNINGENYEDFIKKYPPQFYISLQFPTNYYTNDILLSKKDVEMLVEKFGFQINQNICNQIDKGLYKGLTTSKNFSEIDAERSQASEKNPQREAIQLSSKKENSYLRLIHALSNCLLDRGLTGEPYSDAKKIITKMAGKKIESPVKEDALAKYLKAAEKL